MNSLTKFATIATVAVTTNSQPLCAFSVEPIQGCALTQMMTHDIIGARALQFAMAREHDPQKLQAHIDAYQALVESV